MDLFLKDFSFNLLIWQFLLLSTFLFWLFCLYDILKSKFKANEKLIWTLVVIFIPFLGSIFYLAIGRQHKL